MFNNKKTILCPSSATYPSPTLFLLHPLSPFLDLCRKKQKHKVNETAKEMRDAMYQLYISNIKFSTTGGK